MSKTTLCLGWLIYFGLHSGLASSSVKQIAQRMLGTGYRYYRLGYSILSTVGLIVLLGVNGLIAAPYYFEPQGLARYGSFVLTAFGVIIIQVSFREYKLRAFLGFIPEVHALRRTGILAWVRHPIYSGLILIVIGFFLFIPNLPTLLSCAFMLGYLPVGMWLEERKLVAEYGEAYRAYRKEVPALIPRWSKVFPV